MINRREFLKNSALTAAGLVMTDKLGNLNAGDKNSSAGYDILKEATILSSKLSDIQKKKIFFENSNAVLKKSGRNIS